MDRVDVLPENLEVCSSEEILNTVVREEQVHHLLGLSQEQERVALCLKDLVASHVWYPWLQELVDVDHVRFYLLQVVPMLWHDQNL